MKTRICSSFAAFGAPLKAILVAACFLCVVQADVHAQSANKPVNLYTISYQGSIETTEGLRVSGTHRFTASLYTGPTSTMPIWHAWTWRSIPRPPAAFAMGRRITSAARRASTLLRRILQNTCRIRSERAAQTLPFLDRTAYTRVGYEPQR